MSHHKPLARELQAVVISAARRPLKLAHALHCLAAMHGLPNWNTLAGRLKTPLLPQAAAAGALDSRLRGYGIMLPPALLAEFAARCQVAEAQQRRRRAPRQSLVRRPAGLPQAPVPQEVPVIRPASVRPFILREGDHEPGEMDYLTSRLWGAALLGLINPDDPEEAADNAESVRLAALQLHLPETASLEEVTRECHARGAGEVRIEYRSGALNQLYVPELLIDRYPELD